MMVEVKAIDSGFFVEFGLLESDFNGVLPSMLCLQIDESLKYRDKVGIVFVCVLEDGIKFLSHNLEPEAYEFFLEVLGICHGFFSF